MKQRLLTILLTLLPLVASADESGTCGDDINWTYVESTNTLIISGTGNMRDFSDSRGIPWYSFRNKIFNLIIENGVTSIGSYVFLDCDNLTSVSIPTSVISIGSDAFCSCSTLASITIPKSVTSISGSPFFGCGNLESITVDDSNPIYDSRNNCNAIIRTADNELILGCKNTVIPTNVNSIGEWAFSGCFDLSSIDIPEKVTSIKKGVFYGCRSLINVNIPDGVVSIGENAFSECSALVSITIPNSVTTIGICAFDNCASLSTITIPNSVTTIGNCAFRGCTSLSTIIIPSSVTNIGDFIFDSCTALSSVTFHCTGIKSWLSNNSSVKEVILGDEVRYIEDCAFSGCRKLYSITMSNSVESIGNAAFQNCSSLSDILLSSNLVSINEHTFSGCKNLTSINIPDKVTMIGYAAFAYCSNLASVNIPNSVSEIGSYAFDRCSSLKSITIPDGISGINFCSFQGCTSLTTIEIPNNISYISNYAFNYCNSLESIIIPNGVTSIGEGTFLGCSSLTSITIPNSITEIGTSAFQGCSSLKSIIIPNSIKSIGNLAFSRCSQIEKIIIGSGIKCIGENAFAGIDKLIDISCYAEMVPETERTAFENSYFDYVTLHVPYGSIDDYKTTYPWKLFKDIVSLPKDSYTLRYIIDGVEYKVYDVKTGDNIIPEEEPTKDGFTFSGWSEIPETMPAHDVTITGSFERVYSGGDVANLINLLLFGNVDDEDITLYDMNGDGELNIGDLILIMRAAQNNSRNRSAANRAIAENQSLEFAADIVTMKPGETSALNISLSGSISNIYGIQFEVNLPEGFSLEEGANDKIYEMSANQVDDIICIDRDLGNGTYRFFIYSSTLQELKGGSLMSLNLKADADKALGNYDVNISNVALSDYDGHVTKEDGISVGVKVTDFFTLLYKVDGEDYKSYEIEYGASITPETEPTKEGCTFSGWSEIPETMPANDVMVTGTFTINKYKLTYIVDGEVYKSYELEYGTNITLEAEPTKEGYTFSGWRTIPVTMPANDVTITGTFTINKYTLTYMVDGEVYKTSEVDYGTTITPEAAPTKTGYSFSGWDDVPLTMPANDVTVTGSFIINKYQITYIIDGEVFTTGYVEYGATIVPPTVEEKEGFTFSGWDDIPETMPAHDIVVQASYTSIIGVLMSSQQKVRIYSPNGKKLDKLQKGLNIVILDDGTVKKVVVK